MKTSPDQGEGNTGDATPSMQEASTIHLGMVNYLSKFSA